VSLLDFIGFIFAFAALIFMFAKKKWEERKQRANPEYARQQHRQEKNLQEFMESLEDNEEEKEKEPPPLPSMQKQRVSLSKPPATKAKSKQEPYIKRPESYEVIRGSQVARGASLVKGLKSRRDMLIIKEIFDKPLAIRHEP